MPPGRLKRLVALTLYYGFAKHLPSRGPGSELFRWVRQEVCRGFLDAGGERFNIGSDVHLGTGTQHPHRQPLGARIRIARLSP